MRRIALTLAVLAVLCVAAGRASAHDYHWAYKTYPGYYAPVVRAPVTVVRRVVVPIPAAPRVVYRPVYSYYPYYAPSPYYYYPVPSYGAYYTVGIGF